ncbi:MAG: prolipoprotein diacylglyceryl transferase [Lachnospiraceae bacterium]|nr:prolipoprotein diacylglyceryl transferase [Lachnospiraceae bacterium]
MNVINNISPYGACGILGFSLGIIYLIFSSKKYNLKLDDMLYVYVWGALGAIIGAKLLYLLIEAPQIIDLYYADKLTAETILILVKSGFVFYGGLFGAIISAYLACKYFELDRDKVMSVIMPTLPIAHACGRLGCTIVGCCHGIEVDGKIAITYTHSLYAPNGVHLFPVQAVEAMGNILIAVILIYLSIKFCDGKKSLYTYLILYSIMRFLLEFLRGDLQRGFLGPLSTSQWISIGVMVVALISIFREQKRDENATKMRRKREGIIKNYECNHEEIATK